MIRTQPSFRQSLVLAAVLCCGSAMAANMSSADRSTAKKQADTEYSQDKTACANLSGNAKDVCKEKAEAKHKVALAQMTYDSSGKQSDANKLAKVKADTDYNVAKEVCDDSSGNAKDVCVQQAKTNHVKALADLKASTKSGSAQADARDEKRDADYKLAAEKCDAMAGDAKDSCMKTARTRYGKN